MLEWPLNVVVVRSGEPTILVDAGPGLEFPDFPTAGRLARRLEAAGVDLPAVTDVVLTHTHMDHIGGLLGNDKLLRSTVRSTYGRKVAVFPFYDLLRRDHPAV